MDDVQQESRSRLEYIRHQANEKFDPIRGTMLLCGRTAAPHRVKWLSGEEDGRRNNSHIVDMTHVLALRSFKSGFLEGNTSATRPWSRAETGDRKLDLIPANHEWLDIFTSRIHLALNRSNFYNEAPIGYADFGVFNTVCYYIRELEGRLHFTVMEPGSYKILNDHLGEANILVLERQMSIKTVVDEYGTTKNGKPDWSNFSPMIKDAYEQSNYNFKVDVVTIVMPNKYFRPHDVIGGANRQWVSYTYEVGTSRGTSYASFKQDAGNFYDIGGPEKFLNIKHSKRKPFFIPRANSGNNYEYGEEGPTLWAIGTVNSLNKKAIGKDQALEQMISPTVQGPASLKKSYRTNAPNRFIPLDQAQQSMTNGGIRRVFEINPAIGALIQDVQDLRQMVDKLYFADFLLYLSQNPKTRTATETNAILSEQQLIIGPTLQSLNYTHNDPLWDFVSSWVFDEDNELPEPPPELEGRFIRPHYTSVFAQAQRAADLPQIERYAASLGQIAQLFPQSQIEMKFNTDKYADILADRLYIPAGLNRDQSEVERDRQQAAMQIQQQQMLQETLPAMAGAAKDVGLGVAEEV